MPSERAEMLTDADARKVNELPDPGTVVASTARMRSSSLMTCVGFKFLWTPRRSIVLTLGIAAALPGNPAKPRNMNESQVLYGGSVSP